MNTLGHYPGPAHTHRTHTRCTSRSSLWVSCDVLSFGLHALCFCLCVVALFVGRGVLQPVERITVLIYRMFRMTYSIVDDSVKTRVMYMYHVHALQPRDAHVHMYYCKSKLL